MLSRVREVIQREGPAGLARRAAARVRTGAERARAVAYLDERHVWYVLELTRVQPLDLAEGYELRLAGDAEVDYAGNASQPVDPDAQLWLVEQNGDKAFSCWIYPRRVPVIAAADRVLELPPGVAHLEDSFTYEDHRGRGIAGAAWTAICERLKESGFEVLITKVEVQNAPSRKACKKAGFRAASVMHLRRRGPREQVSFESGDATLTPAEDRVADQLEAALSR